MPTLANRVRWGTVLPWGTKLSCIAQQVEDECLIGIGAIVLNGAHIGQQSIIGAGALIAEGKVIPPRWLVVGMPGRVIRQVSDEEVERLAHGWQHYADAAQQYKARV